MEIARADPTRRDATRLVVVRRSSVVRREAANPSVFWKIAPDGFKSCFDTASL